MISVEAHAKINIDLRVLAKRADGFHEVRTIFQTISLADAIGVEYTAGAQSGIEIEGNVVIEDNLMARAARLILSETDRTGSVHFTLEKRIPMGAGLGGGSSNAAAVLRSLPDAMGVGIALDRLHALAASLGSDVPFFLYGGTAVGLGRGDEVYPLPNLPECFGLLVTPAIHVSTPDAYRAVSARLHSETVAAKLADFARVAWTGDLTLARNDFEEVVFEMHPELAKVRTALLDAGAMCARMTGSGSAIFGLFRERPNGVSVGHPVHAFSLVGKTRYFNSSVTPTTREVD